VHDGGRLPPGTGIDVKEWARGGVQSIGGASGGRSRGEVLHISARVSLNLKKKLSMVLVLWFMLAPRKIRRPTTINSAWPEEEGVVVKY